MNSKILANIVNEMISNISLLENKINISRYGSGSINTVVLAGEKYYYYSTRGITPVLKNFLQEIENESKEICKINLGSSELETEFVKRKLAIEWISKVYSNKISITEWNCIFDYLFCISDRTYENLPNSINIIINLDEKGSICLNDVKEQKILDILACSNYAYIEVDKHLKIIKYDCIDIGDVLTKTTYTDVPDYLLAYSQYASKCGEINKIGISLSRTGDIVLYANNEQILSIRKKRWTIYNNASLKNTLSDVIGGFGSSYAYAIACNLYDMIWNISYRRHGALIIVTSENAGDSHIVNKESILENSCVGELRFAIKEDINKIDISKTGLISKKALLLELVSVDGATVIDCKDGTVRAFGAIVELHNDVDNVSGARTTAAKSAIRHGNMKPIKISSDGDITLYNCVSDTDGNKHYIEFNFC